MDFPRKLQLFSSSVPVVSQGWALNMFADKIDGRKSEGSVQC